MRTTSVILLTAVAASRAKPQRLRVVSFNIHAWRTAEHQDSLERLIALLDQVDADVLCLNEVLHPFVAPPSTHPYWSEVRERRGHGLECPTGTRPDEDSPTTYVARLAAALRMPHHAFFAGTETGSFFGRFPFGNCILSKFELIDVCGELLRVSDADLTLGGQERTPKDLEDRAVLTAKVALPVGGTFGIAVTHLDHKAEELRERQIGEAIQHCNDAFDDSVPSILCGDLNSFDRRDMSEAMWKDINALYSSKGWPPPRATSLVQLALHSAGYADAFALQGEAGASSTLPPPTCWTRTRLDYVMLSSSAQQRCHVLAHRTLVEGGDASDHMPVCVDLEVQPPPTPTGASVWPRKESR